jgi:predicted metal-binding membrane protein
VAASLALAPTSRLGADRSDVVLFGAAAVGWLALVGAHAAASADVVRLPVVGPPAAAMLGWLAMTVAMMLPVARPAVRHVAANSLRRRRGVATAAFVTAFLIVWAAAGAFVFGLEAFVNRAGVGGRPLFVAALAGAALWHVSPARRAVLRQCQRGIPLPPRGIKALVADLRFGAIYASRCVATCGGLMIVMSLINQAHVLWAVAVTAVILTERRLPALRRHPQPVALALVGVLVVTLAVPVDARGGSGFVAWVCQIPRS